MFDDMDYDFSNGKLGLNHKINFINKIGDTNLRDGDEYNIYIRCKGYNGIESDSFFVKFKKGVNTYAKGFYFDLTLADSSGNIEYKYWGGPDEGRIRNLYESIKPDSIVHVQGKIGEYKGRLQFTTNEPFLFEVLKPEQYNDGDFVKVSQRDLEEMYLEILEYIELVENAQIKKLLTTVFHDKEFENRFKKHPGAIEIHHNWVGGLMEHVLQILKYCKTSWEIFPLNKDPSQRAQ